MEDLAALTALNHSGSFGKNFVKFQKNKYVIYRLRVGPYCEKLWPRSRSQFFTIRTSQPANNIFIIQNCTTLSRVDIYNMDGTQQNVKQRKRKPGKRCVVMFCNQTNANAVSLHQFPQTLDAGQYICLQLFHCNSKFLFLTTSTFWQKMFCSSLHIDWQFPHWHLVIKNQQSSNIFTMLTIGNREHNLCDWFHQRNRHKRERWLELKGLFPTLMQRGRLFLFWTTLLFK